MKKLFFVFMLIVIAAAIFTPPRPPETPEQKAARDAIEAKFLVKEIAKKQITTMLRDPESAQFGDVFIGKNDVVCGTVNARNGFGGYTGMQPFTVGSKYARLGDNATDTWNKHCAGVPYTK